MIAKGSAQRPATTHTSDVLSHNSERRDGCFSMNERINLNIIIAPAKAMVPTANSVATT
jgi:hypothetical protein